MLVHELRFDLKVIPSKYKEYLIEGEAVRGETNTLMVTISNKGTSQFPGGFFEYIKVEYRGVSGYSTSTSSWEFAPLPIMQPNAQQTLVLNFTPYNEGICWFYIKIKPPDNEKINYYLGSYQTPSTNDYHSPFYIVNREQIRIILLLEKLIERVDKIP